MWRKKQRETDPIERILNTILAYAIRDGARKIRIETREKVPLPVPPDSTKGVVISYFIGDEWEETMRVPAYVYPALLAEIRKRAAMGETQNEGEIIFKLHDENRTASVSFRVAVKIESDEEISLHFGERKVP